MAAYTDAPVKLRPTGYRNLKAIKHALHFLDGAPHKFASLEQRIAVDATQSRLIDPNG